MGDRCEGLRPPGQMGMGRIHSFSKCFLGSCPVVGAGNPTVSHTGQVPAPVVPTV